VLAAMVGVRMAPSRARCTEELIQMLGERLVAA
jgi:hypothetical protein